MSVFQPALEACELPVDCGFQEALVANPGGRYRVGGSGEVLDDDGVDGQHIVDCQEPDIRER